MQLISLVLKFSLKKFQYDRLRLVNMTGKTTKLAQILNQSGHCPLTGGYFEPWALFWRVKGVPTPLASNQFWFNCRSFWPQMKFTSNDFDDDLFKISTKVWPKISTYSGYTEISRPITVLKAATFPETIAISIQFKIYIPALWKQKGRQCFSFQFFIAVMISHNCGSIYFGLNPHWPFESRSAMVALNEFPSARHLFN